MTLCEYIDSVLKEKKMSRRKLALFCGIPPSSLQAAFERNKTLSLDMLLPILINLRLYAFDPLKFGYDSSTVPIIKKTLSEYEDKAAESNYEFSTNLIPNYDFGSPAEFKKNNRENMLIDHFRKLNDDGQIVAIQRVEELTEIKKYRKSENETSGNE